MKKIIVLSMFAFVMSTAVKAQVQSSKRAAIAKTEKKQLKEALKSKRTKEKLDQLKLQARKQD